MGRYAASVLLCSVALSSAVFAQEAPPPQPTHDQSTVFAEPKAITKALDLAGGYLGDGNGDEKTGFYAAFGRIASGAGWISVGPGYRQRVLDDRAIIDASAAVSWRAYKHAQARFAFTDLANSRIAVGAQVAWQDLTQLNYFGIGAESSADARSEFRLKTADAVGYMRYKPVRWLAFAASGGRLDAVTIDSPTGPFDRNFPDAREVFASDPGFALAKQPAFAHGRLSLTADNRNYPDHPSNGGLYRVAWSRFADLDLSAFSFSRYEAEAAHFVPLLHGGVVFVLHGWTVLSDTADGQIVPPYLMPSLGGSHTLRAFPNYRFHDRHLLVTNLEARIALTTHLDTALFVDAGRVAAEIEQLGLANRSYGLGLRVHTHKRTTMRVDIAHGNEGWQLSFSLSDPFRLRRLEQYTAAVPFVP